jgi:WXG100 family type VII secretion target
MSEILLKAEDARNAATDMRSRATTAQDQFTSTRSRLTELGSSFKGKTATAFDAKFDEWHASAKQLIEALNGLAGFLDSAANAIEETDASIANQLNG